MKLEFHESKLEDAHVPHGEYIAKRLAYYSDLVLQNGEFMHYRAGGPLCSYTRENRTGGLGSFESKKVVFSVLINRCEFTIPVL